MNTYLIPVKEKGKLCIKKISAASEQAVEEKLYEYFFNKYEFVEGDSLDEIRDQLRDSNIEFGQFYDIEEL
jgi:hypothetical protein